MTEIPRPREQSPGARFTGAMDGFVSALNAPGRQFSGVTLEERFLAVERAIALLPNVPESKKFALAHGLAGRGAQVAEERGYPGTADLMKGFQERIQDQAAIRNGEYTLVRIHRDHGEQHGAPDTTTPIYVRPDGVEVRGQSFSVGERFGHNGILRDVPRDVTTVLLSFGEPPAKV